jgi:hypothetical protein
LKNLEQILGCQQKFGQSELGRAAPEVLRLKLSQIATYPESAGFYALAASHERGAFRPESGPLLKEVKIILPRSM